MRRMHGGARLLEVADFGRSPGVAAYVTIIVTEADGGAAVTGAVLLTLGVGAGGKAAERVLRGAGWGAVDIAELVVRGAGSRA